MPDINKEFEGLAIDYGLSTDKVSENEKDGYQFENTEAAYQVFFHAVAPRDLLIEQLVKAQRELLTCLEGWTLDDESEKAIKRACAALSAAKERGYL